VSDPEVTDGVVDEKRALAEGWPMMDDGAGIPVTVQGAAPEPTGDDAVDAALRQLDGATDEPLDVQIEVAERVHRVLQGRLADLGQE
jgi:hypothetical protein